MKKLLKLFLALLLMTTDTVAQQQVISGSVVDKDGTPVQGASVMIKGTARGVSTDAQGKFSMDVVLGSTLIISSVGYTPREVTVTGMAISITLQPDGKDLGEVVVVGYGT